MSKGMGTTEEPRLEASWCHPRLRAWAGATGPASELPVGPTSSVGMHVRVRAQ